MRRVILPVLICFFLTAGSSAWMLAYLDGMAGMEGSIGYVTSTGRAVESVKPPVPAGAPAPADPAPDADADETAAEDPGAAGTPAAGVPEGSAQSGGGAAGVQVHGGGDPMIGPNGKAVDFGAYHAVNTDVIAHIHIPGTNVDYPLMQEFEVAPEESYYLWRDWQKRRNSWGSILTPKLPQNDLDDPHLLIFGHNMGGSSVGFSGLKSWYGTDAGRNAHPYVYLYYPDRTERWVVWAAGRTNKDDMVYTLDYHPNTPGYQNLIDHLAGMSVYGSAPGAPSTSEHIIVLSTCDGGAGTPNRFIVSAKLDAVTARA